MPPVSILIKPASSGCNIACRYCFYHAIAENRCVADYGIMSEETLDRLVRETIAYADGFAAFAFQGGEPTLAGLDFFRKTVELQKKYNTKRLEIQNTIQTNGVLITEEWAKFLAENNFLVGLSLDGPRAVNDYCRVNAAGKSIFDRVIETVKLFRKYNVQFNICTVVTKKTAEKMSSVYNYFKQMGFMYQQYIPCLDEQGGEKSDYSLTPEQYGDFLNKLFDLWYKDFSEGLQIDIRQFSNFAQMAAGYAPEECGMCGKCTTYFVVESDGSVYPCDFYTTDDWRLGDVSEGFGKLYSSEKSLRFMEESVDKPEECRKCSYYSLCRGGCRRWRDVYGGGLGMNFLCEGYKRFFSHCESRIIKLGDHINSRYGKNLSYPKS